MVKNICKCIVNSQNVLKLYVCSNIQFNTVCREFTFPPRFFFLQHLAVDVNVLTRNVSHLFRLLLGLSFSKFTLLCVYSYLLLSIFFCVRANNV